MMQSNDKLTKEDLAMLQFYAETPDEFLSYYKHRCHNTLLIAQITACRSMLDKFGIVWRSEQCKIEHPSEVI